MPTHEALRRVLLAKLDSAYLIWKHRCATTVQLIHQVQLQKCSLLNDVCVLSQNIAAAVPPCAKVFPKATVAPPDHGCKAGLL